MWKRFLNEEIFTLASEECGLGMQGNYKAYNDFVPPRILYIIPSKKAGFLIVESNHSTCPVKWSSTLGFVLVSSFALFAGPRITICTLITENAMKFEHDDHCRAREKPAIIKGV